MSSPDIPIEEAELRVAYDTAQGVCNTLESVVGGPHLIIFFLKKIDFFSAITQKRA